MQKIIFSILLFPFYFVFWILENLIWLCKVILGAVGLLSSDKFIRAYTSNQLIASDQSVNSLLLGDPDETISSRVGKNMPNSIACKIINMIVWWQPKHCQTHTERDEGKNDLIFGKKK